MGWIHLNRYLPMVSNPYWLFSCLPHPAQIILAPWHTHFFHQIGMPDTWMCLPTGRSSRRQPDPLPQHRDRQLPARQGLQRLHLCHWGCSNHRAGMHPTPQFPLPCMVEELYSGWQRGSIVFTLLTVHTGYPKRGWAKGKNGGLELSKGIFRRKPMLQVASLLRSQQIIRPPLDASFSSFHLIHHIQ